MADLDQDLRDLIDVILSCNRKGVSEALAASPRLARAEVHAGATRQKASPFFLAAIQRYLVAGDTALHIAAAGYHEEIADMLIRAGADVRAKNRFGDEPLHAAAVGSPGSKTWNPQAQSATIVCLIEAGADVNAVDKRGVSPLHRAVRTRCAEAVSTLLQHGADANCKNRNGSTPLLLATQNTGRPGSGSAAAKEQQGEIVRLLKERGGVPNRPR